MATAISLQNQTPAQSPWSRVFALTADEVMESLRERPSARILRAVRSDDVFEPARQGEPNAVVGVLPRAMLLPGGGLEPPVSARLNPSYTAEERSRGDLPKRLNLESGSLDAWRVFFDETFERLREAIEENPRGWGDFLWQFSSTDPVSAFLNQLGISIQVNDDGSIALSAPPIAEVVQRFDRLKNERWDPWNSDRGGMSFIRSASRGNEPSRIFHAELGVHLPADVWPRARLHLAILLNPGATIKPGSDRHFGGITHFVRNLAVALAHLEPGVQVDVLSMAAREKDFEVGTFPHPSLPNLRFIRLDSGTPFRVGPDEAFPEHVDIWTQNVLDFYWQEGRLPDCWSGHAWVSGEAARRLAEETGTPYTYQPHVAVLRQWRSAPAEVRTLAATEGDPVQHAYREAALVVQSGALFVNSQWEIRHLGDLVPPKEPRQFVGIHVARPGIDARIFTATRQPEDRDFKARMATLMEMRGIPPERRGHPWIVALNASNPVRNAVAVIEAFARSPELRRSTNVVIPLDFGMDDTEDPLRTWEELTWDGARLTLGQIAELIERYGLGDSIVAFSLRQRDAQQAELASLFRVAAERRSVYAVATWWELYGMSIFEAMACGLPGVVTANSPHANADYARSAPPDDPEAIASALLSVLPPSPRATTAALAPEWWRLRERGLEVVDGMNWKDTAAAYLEACRKVVAWQRPYTMEVVPGQQSRSPKRSQRRRDERGFNSRTTK